jgi:hypothetical protein
VGPRASGDEKNSQPLTGLEPPIIQRYTNELSRLIIIIIIIIIIIKGLGPPACFDLELTSDTMNSSDIL